METLVDIKEFERQVAEERKQAEEREARKTPKEAPYVVVESIEFGAHVLRFGRNDGRLGMPKGVVRLELFYVLHTARDHAPLGKAEYWRSFVESPIRVSFDVNHDKLTATYYARWANAYGDVGPWSEPFSKTIVV